MTTPTPPHNPTGTDEAGEYDDFDAWLASQASGRRVKILGEIVTLPDDIPLGYRAKLTRAQHSDDEEEIKELVGLIFGEGALDRWTEANIGIRAFQTLLVYGDAHLAGKPVTFAEAAEAVRKAADADAGPEGKAPTGRKKTKKGRRGPGGGSPATGR